MSRSITSNLEDHFGQDLTTLALCFDIERRDGTVLGFTNHDVTITYSSVDYDPFSSADVTNLEQLASTDADNMEMSIAFDSAHITKEDVQKGKYDHAFMRLFMINYADTSMGIVKLISGYLGPTEVVEYGGKAEMLSLVNMLKTEIGEYYSYKCRAEFGDSRCKLNTSNYEVSGEADIVTDRKTFTDSSSARNEVDDYFKYGTVTFTSGNNSGWTREVKDFVMDSDGGQFTMLFAFPFAIQAGDTYTARPGCSNYPSDCKTKWSSNNIVNYRGEPFLPGRDELIKYPDAPS